MPNRIMPWIAERAEVALTAVYRTGELVIKFVPLTALAGMLALGFAAGAAQAAHVSGNYLGKPAPQSRRPLSLTLGLAANAGGKRAINGRAAIIL